METATPTQHVAPSFIIVVGSSAGGLTALTELVSQLKPGMDASVVIVMHLTRKGISDFLIHRLQQYTSLSCEVASNRTAIQRGHIYLAPSNHHLLIKDNKMIIGCGPEENRWRPSIDVLFRSAAVAFGNHTIGVIITGLLDDGTAGMMAIRKCGGICIVQDPNEAEYPDMPLSVLSRLEADYCISLADMGFTLQRLTNNVTVQQIEIPADIVKEALIAERVATGIDVVKDATKGIGEQAVYTCPDCGGAMWNITANNISRYRCHVGHSYSESDLVIKQAHHLEATLWVALRMMEERKNLLHKLTRESKKRGAISLAVSHEEKEKELQQHIDKLKEILFSTQNVNP